MSVVPDKGWDGRPLIEYQWVLTKVKLADLSLNVNRF